MPCMSNFNIGFGSSKVKKYASALTCFFLLCTFRIYRKWKHSMHLNSYTNLQIQCVITKISCHIFYLFWASHSILYKCTMKICWTVDERYSYMKTWLLIAHNSATIVGHHFVEHLIPQIIPISSYSISDLDW